MASNEEYDESAMEDGMPGPGAPTPLTALEVRVLAPLTSLLIDMMLIEYL